MTFQNTERPIRNRSSQRTTDAAPTQATPSSRIDWIIFLVVLAVSILTFSAMWPSLNTSTLLAQGSKVSWYFVRAAGLSAYALLAASTVWGLFLTSRIIADWSPGPMSMLFHASTSWLAVVLSIAHAALLLLDTYYTYTITDLIMPFVGPYRPFAVGIGVVAAWLTLAITISFSLRKMIGQRVWRWLHYASYVVFALVTAHGVLAGTDSENVGTRITYIGMAVIVLALLLRRATSGRHVPKRTIA
jgi:methionine sulfoxide reductase heme-binding subunit